MSNRFYKEHPLRYGMVGGGATSQIGDSHRVALRRDSYYQLVAGTFDIDVERGRLFGESLGLDSERIYSDFQKMVHAELNRDDGIQVAGIMTPNSTHYTIAKTFIEAGFHVILEKPITTTTGEALDLMQLAEEKNVLCASSYGYSGYPMIRQARAMVAGGELGEIRVVQTEFAHGNCATAVEKHSEGAAWRNDPKTSGGTFVLGDVGTHALHLATLITGQQVHQVSADCQSFVEGRVLEDNAHVLLRFEGGAAGYLWASGVAVGHRHGLAIRVFGSKAGIEWHQERPNQLLYSPLGETPLVLELDSPELHPAAKRLLRVGAGHPEGYFEAFSNIYSDFAEVLLAKFSGNIPDPASMDFPTLEDGAQGVRFLEACVESAENKGCWVNSKLSDSE
jgi:predicted dehydrogenase